METKICTKCGEEKSLKSYTFLKLRQCYDSRCRECQTHRTAEWRANNIERHRKYDREYKYSQKTTNPFWARVHNIRRSMIQHAKKIGVTVAISKANIKAIYDKQQGRCFYSGLPMKLQGEANRDPMVMSCDRINSFEGYTATNVVLCCWGMNALKGQHSPEVLYRCLNEFYHGAISLGKIKEKPPEGGFSSVVGRS